MKHPFDPDVFAFLDFREYLREFYARRKEKTAFSYRAFSRRAGLKSPNYLKLVIDGQRNLTAPMAERFAEACGLEGDEAAFFVELVNFGQSQSLADKNESYSRLARFRQYRKIHTLRIAEDAYHSRWYLPAVRELALRQDFQPDPHWIAGQLIPSIKAEEASEALVLLKQLGMLEEDGDGNLVQGTPLVSTGNEVASLHLMNFHRTMMAHAASALERIGSDDRDISSVTLCVNEGRLPQLKQALQRFRKELLSLSEMEDSPSQVVQINFQLFPLSHPSKEES